MVRLMSPERSLSSEDAFAALGNEVRITILRVLIDAIESEGRYLSFTEIYERLELDSTSQLSYHLGRLTGVFVRKSSEGYALTQIGERVVRAVLSGAYSEQPSFEPTTIEGSCPSCKSTTLSAVYRNPNLTVRCDSCETTVVTYELPPAESKGRTSVEILHSCDQRRYHEYGMALRGTCPMCGGETNREIHQHDGPGSHYCIATCVRCRHQVYSPLEVRLLYHPAVISFYWEHGVDASRITAWQLFDYIENWELDVLRADPFLCQVSVAYQSDQLRTTIDESLTVSVQG